MAGVGGELTDHLLPHDSTGCSHWPQGLLEGVGAFQLREEQARHRNIPRAIFLPPLCRYNFNNSESY